jgi:hypothetical protein
MTTDNLIKVRATCTNGHCGGAVQHLTIASDKFTERMDLICVRCSRASGGQKVAHICVKES